METRNKTKTLVPTEEAGSSENLLQELATKEYEIERMEKAVGEREKRLNAQENMMRQEIDRIEIARAQLEREREKFDRSMTTRETVVAAKERELEQKILDVELERFNTPTRIPPRETSNIPRTEYEPTRSPTRLPPSGGGGNGGSGGGDPPTLKVSFREATESVPYFDGYNIPLAQFTRACRRAFEIIPPTAERNLTKLLINKLGRRAYYAVEDEPCDTVTELIDLLTGAFGSPKTLDQYRGELSTVYLRHNEHVLDYISRVKDIRTAILDTERREKKRLDPRFITEIDDLTARSFYEGLPMEYRLQMSDETRRKHTDAFVAAKAIAKRQELERQRYDPRYRSDRDRDTRSSTHPAQQRLDRTAYRGLDYPSQRETRVNTYRQPDHQRINSQRDPPVRSYDPRDRYSFDRRPDTRPDAYYQRPYSQREPPSRSYDPRNRDNAERQQETRPYRQSDYPRTNLPREPQAREYGSRDGNNFDSPREARPNDKVCRYCKGIGHEIEECRKRQYNNSRRETPGNMPGPSGRRDMTPADEQRRTRPLNPIAVEEDRSESDPESQS
jgi:hypothetical protein